MLLLFFFTLVTGPRRSLIYKLSDTRVYEHQVRARLGTTEHLCEVVVLVDGVHMAARATSLPRPAFQAMLLGFIGHRRDGCAGL